MEKAGPGEDARSALIVRKAYGGAALACCLVLAVGILALYRQQVLRSHTHHAIHVDTLASAIANRVLAEALQCRRYEKDVFLNLADEPKRTEYIQRWEERWHELHDAIHQLEVFPAQDDSAGHLDEYLSLATDYRDHFRDVIKRILAREIDRPEQANLAITPFKDEIRRVIDDATELAEERAAQAKQSASELEKTIVVNLVLTCVLIVVPSALILLWTLWLIREIVARNVELVRAKRSADLANRAKGEFLANMSHEIRTPMTAILGFADILLEHAAMPEDVEAVHTIKRNGDYLLRLINDILDLSKIEAGKFTVHRIPCCPSAIVAEVASLMRVPAEAKNLPLLIEFAGPIPETIDSDPLRLRQILVNLVGNAIKFTEIGNVRLVVQMCGKNALRFSVVDTGIGMTPEQMSLLFRPFSQADSSVGRTFGGTGLGLAISKRLAEMLGGSITASSVAGKGSAFALTLDVGSLAGVRLLENTSELLQGWKLEAVTRPAMSLKPHCRILLAEDGPDNQRLLAFLLHKAGAEVVVVDNGKAAVDRTLAASRESKPFDVLLMDMQMPIMDGYRATRELRVAGYTGPIVALTAHAMLDDRQKCLDAGCDDYTTKPIDRDRFLETVAKYASVEPPVLAQASSRAT